MNKLGLAALLTLALSLAFVNVANAAVPDKLSCSAEPAKIHATWDPSNPSTTSITVQLMAEYADGTLEPVRKSGVEITCESQNPDILQVPGGGASQTDTTDEFGRVTFTFESSGNHIANVGSVNIVCRSLQLDDCQETVTVEALIPDTVELSMCPNGDATGGDYPDILADGESKVVIAAQLKNGAIPVKKSGVTVKFISSDTSIVKECDSTDPDGMGPSIVVSQTNDQGVAYAEFCSAGSGSENVGTATITVEVDGGYGISTETIDVTTTNNFGTTTVDGKLFVSAFPTQILADGESTLQACVQLRKTNGLIIKNPPEKVVSLISNETSKLLPVFQPDPTNPAYTEANENASFPQGGVYTALFRSAGIYDPNSVGSANIKADAEFFESDNTTVELVGSQYWPNSIELTASPEDVLCDGVSTVKVTAQLVDSDGLPVFMEGRLVRFLSQNPALLVDADDGDAIVTATTNEFGVAVAEFRAKECKLDNVDGGNVTIHASSISDQVNGDVNVTVISPKGFVPTGVNAYTDHTLEHRDGDHDNTEGIESHAAPALISADGEKPVYVTAQVCEWTTDVEDRDGDGNTTEEFCNPVKRPGVRIEFKVEDDNIVMNKRDFPGQNDPEDGVDVVYLETDDEGKATAVFRSTGTTPGINEGCTNIRITAQNGNILDGPTYARVCAVQHEATTPNAVWVWAQPAFITADGTSSTTLRTALYWCNDDNNNGIADVVEYDGGNQTVVQKASSLPTGVSGLKPDDLTGLDGVDSNESTYCKPVQLDGQTIKFEVDDPQIIDDGTGGYRIITTTDQYGQAEATFYSAGSDDLNIGKTEVTVYYNGPETVSQLNKLYVHTEEKTWPWSIRDLSTYGTGAVEADTSGDGFISDSELLSYLLKGALSGFTDPDVTKILQAITAWADQ